MQIRMNSSVTQILIGAPRGNSVGENRNGY